MLLLHLGSLSKVDLPLDDRNDSIGRYILYLRHCRIDGIWSALPAALAYGALSSFLASVRGRLFLASSASGSPNFTP